MDSSDAHTREYMNFYWPYAVDFIETLNGLEVNVCLEKTLNGYREGNLNATVAFLVFDFFAKRFKPYVSEDVYEALLQDQLTIEVKADEEYENFKHFHTTNIKGVL